MTKAAIFDLNGVFIQSPPLSKRFESDHGVPVDTFLSVLSQVMDVTRKPGAEDIYHYVHPHLQKWNVHLSRQEFLAYWFSAEHENKEMITYARELKTNGWKLFILSNNFRERTEYYALQFPFLHEIFDGVYYSWQTGNVKPGEQCFAQILEEQDLSPQDCYYFDDSEKNVDAAVRVGIKGYKFCGMAETKRILDET